MQEYAAVTGPTIAAHGGTLVLRGASPATLIVDEADQHTTRVVQFPELDALNAWFNSSECQQHAPLRDEAGEMQFVPDEAPAA